MVWMILLTVVLLLLLLYTLIDIYLIYVKKVPPGPLSLPLIGGLHHLSPTHPHISMTKLADKYGGLLSLRMGPLGRVVFINDVHYAEEILNNTTTANRPPMPYFDIISKDADGIGSCCYSPKWKIQTKIIKATLTKMCQTSLSEKAHNVLCKLFERFNKMNGQSFDPEMDLHLACINLLSSTIYGNDYDDWDDAEIQTMAHYHDVFISGLNPAHPLNLFPFIKHLPLKFVKRHFESVKQRDVIASKKYEAHKTNFNGNIMDIIDMVIAANDNNNNELNLSYKQRSHLDKNSLMMSAWTLNMAGIDDLQAIFSWLMLYLALYPEVKEMITTELKENVSPGSYPTIHHKKYMPYTEATTLEVLRIVPVNIFGIPHCTYKEITVGGYSIPKGSTIFTNMWHIHHQEKHWPQPDVFKPSRFINKDGTVISTQDRKSMPFMTFGKGKRTCIGSVLALDMIFLFTSSLIQKYDVSLPKNFVPDMRGKVLFGLSPCKYKIILTKRKDKVL